MSSWVAVYRAGIKMAGYLVVYSECCGFSRVDIDVTRRVRVEKSQAAWVQRRRALQTVKSPKSCRSAISELYSKRFSVESPHDGHTIVV